MAAAAAAALVMGAPVAGAEPEFRTLECTEDMPCWRVWFGNGTAGADAPAYMYLPEGELFDSLAPMFGYEPNA